MSPIDGGQLSEAPPGRSVGLRSGRAFPIVIWVGLAVVLAAAAVLSFDALRNLATAVRIAPSIAWLLPISIDAGAAVSCAVWLGRQATAEASRYAGRMTWCLLAVTVLGNATAQGMASAGIVPPWWVAVLVGAIPPAVVGSSVHLVVLLVRRSADQPAEQPRHAADLVPELADERSKKVRVMELLAEQPDLTAEQVAEQLDCTPRYVRKLTAS